VDSALPIRKNIGRKFSRRNETLSEFLTFRIFVLLHLPNHLSQHTEQKLRIALLQMQPPYYTPDGGMKRLRSIQFRNSLARSATARIDNPLDLG